MTQVTRYNPFRDKFEKIADFDNEGEVLLRESLEKVTPVGDPVLVFATRESSQNPAFLYFVESYTQSQRSGKVVRLDTVFRDGHYVGSAEYYGDKTIRNMQVDRAGYIRLLDTMIADLDPSNQSSGLIPTEDGIEDLRKNAYDEAFRSQAAVLQELFRSALNNSDAERELAILLKYVKKLKAQTK